ncbi:ABC-type cobalt transport system, permease component CbiQ [Sphaerochaeta pleomorpha str. Grapes]|uniref:ABC-type cobalt transport system, permease component CbiQ n=1 Tax=Sphaerochaeta pleomorpha (strain ATCC BAA-1885 / DSM 22778 / Grapes) TaxID=158190 RepID=G8QSM9_SPHPG|nr:energy-coupling factor transporter transmembrane component T [Sphaerochaeta pleomorpha]AEV28990.1 ABC-type cobalt transport system, permease component CbiQ [Sphaerochaeta pleomorpha str. Grapes]
MTTNTFVAGNSFLYRFDPRAKVLLLVLFCVWFFLPVTLTGLYGVVFLIIVVGTINTGLEQSWKTFLSILPMLVFMVLFIPFNVRSGQSLISFGSFVFVTKEGLLQATRLAGRFIGITYVCTLLFATTRMNEVMLALRWYRLPYKASLVITLAFTYIPFIADSFIQIADSHRLREAGEGEGKKNIFSRLSNLVPTLTSALVVALRSIPNLAMSLEQRGFGRSEKRSSYHSLESYRHTFTQFVVSVIIPLILWYICKIQ